MGTRPRRRALTELYQASVEAYQESVSERRELAARWRGRDEVSPLDEIEVLATDIGGYVSQLIHAGAIASPQEALRRLREFTIQDVPSIAALSQDGAGSYPQLRQYLRLLEQLRREAIAYLEEET